MTPYQDTLLTLAIESESAALELWWKVDELGDELFAAALAATIAIYNGRANSLAAVAFAAQASIAADAAVAVEPIPFHDDTNRLAKAATTVLSTARASEVPDDIIARLGRAEPLTTAARTYTTAMASSPRVDGWTRQLDADPCELCRFWAANGRVFNKKHEFRTHVGCVCVPRPVWLTNHERTAR